MPLNQYGVLKGWAIDQRLGSGRTPHDQAHMIDETDDYRTAVNMLSKLAPSQLEDLIDSRLDHAFLSDLEILSTGCHDLPQQSGGPALDTIRSNPFDPRSLRPLPSDLPGPTNDQREMLDHCIQCAMADKEALPFAFGERRVPHARLKDKIFSFLPRQGVRDIHMNQGNDERFKGDDRAYLDGALPIHFSRQHQSVGIFFKFQSQPWHTDERPGRRTAPYGSGPQSVMPLLPNPFEPAAVPSPEASDGSGPIVAALANAGGSPEIETVTLLDVMSEPIDHAGWKLLDRSKQAMALAGRLPPEEAQRVPVRSLVVLSNKGGLITLLSADGLRVDGVSYTKAQALLASCTIKF